MTAREAREELDEQLLTTIRAGRAARTAAALVPGQRGALATFTPYLHTVDGTALWSYLRCSIEPGSFIPEGVTWLEASGHFGPYTFSVRRPLIVGAIATPPTEIVFAKDGKPTDEALPFEIPAPLHFPALEPDELDRQRQRMIRDGDIAHDAIFRALENLIRTVAAKCRAAMRTPTLVDVDDLAQRAYQTVDAIIDKYTGPSRPLCPLRVALLRNIIRDLGSRNEAKLLGLSEKVLRVRKALDHHPEITSAATAAQWWNTSSPRQAVSEHVAATALAVPSIIGGYDGDTEVSPSAEECALRAQSNTALRAWMTTHLSSETVADLAAWLAGDRKALPAKLSNKIRPHLASLAVDVYPERLPEPLLVALSAALDATADAVPAALAAEAARHLAGCASRPASSS
jgi:hypothetical protein